MEEVNTHEHDADAESDVSESHSNTQPAQPTDSSRARAEAMIANRVRPKTAANYRNKLKQMGRWLRHERIGQGALVDEDGMPKLPLSEAFTVSFLGAVTEVRTVAPPAEDPASVFGKPKKKLVENGGHVASSVAGGHKSAMVWWYAEKNMTMDATLNASLNRLISGYKKTVADLKQTGVMSAFEGKQALSFQGYQLMAKKFATLTPEVTSTGNHRGTTTAATFMEGVFAWCFLLLQWNFIARSCTIAEIMLAHIGWRDDHLICTTPRTKTDTTAEKSFPKSFFANPSNPFICPILALAVFFFSRPTLSRAQHKLFDGENQEDRYSKLLTRALQSLPDSLAAHLGAKRDEIGTHGAGRKGPASFVLAHPGGPTAVSVYLRAGWSLGNVQDRYIFEGEGSDQFCGRALCGLNLNDVEFALLPPHFTKETELTISDTDWQIIMPNYNMFPETFRHCTPYFLASLVFHVDFLRNNLSEAHPLFQSQVFVSGTIERLRGSAMTGSSRCARTGMQACGIPPFMMTAVKVNLFEARLQVVEGNMQQAVTESTNSIIKKLEELPIALREAILENFVVEGAVPITRADMEKQFNSLSAELLATISARLGPLPASTSTPQESHTEQPTTARWRTWVWGGLLRQRIVLVGPLCGLHESDLTGPDRAQLSRCRGLIKALEVQEPRLDNSELSKVARAQLFDGAFDQLVREIYGKQKPRCHELQVGTLYNKLCLKRKSSEPSN